MFTNFFHHLLHYTRDVFPSLFLGFLLSGVIHEFVPQSLVDRYFSRKNISSIIYVTLAGIFLPVCCFGSLPIAVGFRKKGVPLGPILAFLIATPATSLTAILVTWRLLGFGFTLYLCLTVILMGVIAGIIGNFLSFPEMVPANVTCVMCDEGEHKNHQHHSVNIKDRLTSVLTFGFIDMPKEIGLEVLIGLVLAALVASFTPLGMIIQNYLTGISGYLFAWVFGLLMYICSTASVPLVHAFINQGLNIGAGLVLLLVGPITSYGTILVIRKEFGSKILLIYLGIITSISLLAGYLFSLLVK